MNSIDTPSVTERDNFYRDIKPLTNIRQITENVHYHEVPADWYVVMTDVVGSTIAIETGRYKDVNAIAAASIAGVLNAVKGMDIPFVFGGDGASALVPEHVFDAVREALLAARQLAEHAFQLELRVGMVPVKVVYEAGYGLRVAKLHISDNFQQAIFTGGGLSYAEELIKDPRHSVWYQFTSSTKHEGDFSGFECRWREVPTQHEEIVSLMVLARDIEPDQQTSIYGEIIDHLDRIYGGRDQRHPLALHKMRLRTLPSAFKTEAKIRYNDISFARLRKMAINTFKARIAMWFNIQGWKQYKRLLIEATDNEKCDDTLRLTISGTKAQRAALTVYLDELYADKQIFYGMQTAQNTLITCIVYDYFGKQVHFVDGAGGGYALAAKMLKGQVAAAKAETETPGV